MAPSNAKVSDLLRRYANALILKGADRFKVKAYHRAADALDTYPEDVSTLVSRGEDLKKIPGVGTAISAKIKDIVTTGKLTQLDQSLANLKPELVELATRPGLDPKKITRIYKKLGIHSLKELKKRLDSGEIGRVLGTSLEYHVRQGLDPRQGMLLWDAEKIAIRVEEFLTGLADVSSVSRVGSLRRRKETVGDLNFLVSGPNEDAIFKKFAGIGAVQRKGRRTGGSATYQFSNGTSVTLTFSPLEVWGLKLLVETGSPAHIDELKTVTKKRTLTAKSLGKYAADEAAVYKKLRLKYIEPELREGRGEVAAARHGSLPKLVELEQLRGDLHMHTTASDGANSIEQMAREAQRRGYKYIAITDHSQSLRITNGLSEGRLREQLKKIDKLNVKLRGITILKSAEVDILEDGSLDYSDSILKELDLTICSIHSRFALNSHVQTERIMRAMDNPHFNILGHATGRLLLKRPGYAPNIQRLIEHAAQCGCYFEINSSPDRLDLSDEHARSAKEAGIKIAINTDAHRLAEMNFITAGINQARRAWLEPADVLNTYTLAKLKKLLAR